jgi:hypothetical protein
VQSASRNVGADLGALTTGRQSLTKIIAASSVFWFGLKGSSELIFSTR